MREGEHCNDTADGTGMVKVFASDGDGTNTDRALRESAGADGGEISDAKVRTGSMGGLGE